MNKEMVTKIWKDPVWSKVIAALILSAGAALLGLLVKTPLEIVLFIIILLLLVLIFLLIRQNRIKNINTKTDSASSIADYLLNYFKELKKDKKNNSLILRWGLAVSKPLWVNDKYEIHRDIGNIIYDAAKDKNDEKAQIYVLINNIGWTNVELLKYDVAKKSIDDGIKLLEKEENADYYLLAKAHRHLVSINIRTNNMDKKEECEKHLKECRIATKSYIKLRKSTTNTYEKNKKNRLLAEYCFTQATYRYKCGEYIDAFRYIELSEKLYKTIKNKKWEVKILARKGDILLQLLDRESDAFVAFKTGKKLANEEKLNKPLVKNLIGLCDYYSKQEDYDTATKQLKEAEEIAEKIKMCYEIQIIKQKYQDIEEIKVNQSK